MTSIRSLALFNGNPSVVMWLVGTATVTTQGPAASTTRRTKSGDFYLATTGDSDLATSGDFFMATDTNGSGWAVRDVAGHGDGGQQQQERPGVPGSSALDDSPDHGHGRNDDETVDDERPEPGQACGHTAVTGQRM